MRAFFAVLVALEVALGGAMWAVAVSAFWASPWAGLVASVLTALTWVVGIAALRLVYESL